MFLTLSVLRLLSYKAPSETCHVGIHWIALVEYSQMSTHVPGFQSFFRSFFASFCNGQISHHQLKVEPYPIPESFVKLKYLKTELNVDNGTYAIV